MTPTQSPSQGDTPRGGVPFAWLDKRILRRIGERCEDHLSSQAVYLALCIAASDRACETFAAPHSWLAKLAGSSVATVRRRLPELAAIGAVRIETPALRAPSKFTLLDPNGRPRTLGNHDRTQAHGDTTHAQGDSAHYHGQTPAVIANRIKEEGKGAVSANRNSNPRGTISTADRIGLEKKLGILKDKLKRFEQGASDLDLQDQAWIEKRKALRAGVAAAEDRFLEAT